MAEYTISIKDIEGGISIGLTGEGEQGSMAGMTALSLVMQAQRAARLARKAAGPEGCNCAVCQAARISTPKPTLH